MINDKSREYFVEEERPAWFLMFVAALLLFAAYACVQVRRRTAETRELCTGTTEACRNIREAMIQGASQ